MWDGWRSTDRKEDSLSGTVMQPKRSAAEGDKHDETKRRGIFLLKSAEMKIVCVCNIVTDYNVQIQWNIHEHYQRRLARLHVLLLQSRPPLQICEKTQPTFRDNPSLYRLNVRW